MFATLMRLLMRLLMRPLMRLLMRLLSTGAGSYVCNPGSGFRCGGIKVEFDQARRRLFSPFSFSTMTKMII
jgi:hypothetical protein